MNKTVFWSYSYSLILWPEKIINSARVKYRKLVLLGTGLDFKEPGIGTISASKCGRIPISSHRPLQCCHKHKPPGCCHKPVRFYHKPALSFAAVWSPGWRILLCQEKYLIFNCTGYERICCFLPTKDRNERITAWRKPICQYFKKKIIIISHLFCRFCCSHDRQMMLLNPHLLWGQW